MSEKRFSTMKNYFKEKNYFLFISVRVEPLNINKKFNTKICVCARLLKRIGLMVARLLKK